MIRLDSACVCVGTLIDLYIIAQVRTRVNSEKMYPNVVCIPNHAARVLSSSLTPLTMCTADVKLLRVKFIPRNKSCDFIQGNTPFFSRELMDSHNLS